MLTVTIVAARLGISPRRVRALIAAGRLPATKYGNTWLIQDDDLAAVAVRTAGRPPKPSQ